MRYRREHLKDRQWHKVVIGDLDRIKVAGNSLPRLTGDYMMACGGHWMLIMIERDEDVVALRLMTDFTPDEYRGYGDWWKKKYSSAKGNRIRLHEVV